MSKLYSSVQIGAVHLDHRIVQAPLTRLRSDQPGDVPSPMMVKYYGQRASKGALQIAEATTVSVQGRGYLGAPGSYNDAHVAGWRKITDLGIRRAASSSSNYGMSAGRATSRRLAVRHLSRPRWSR
jgi:N-ethylmaleimide reductase